MANWDNQEKGGTGWIYNEANLTYNENIDPDSGGEVFYNSVGVAPTFTNISKN